MQKKLLFVLACSVFNFGASFAAPTDYLAEEYQQPAQLHKHIPQIIQEGKELLASLYKDEDFKPTTLHSLLDQPVMEDLKYAPNREKGAIISGTLRQLSSYWYGDPDAEARKKKMTDIATLMWGLFGQSVDRGDGFERGSYKIIDPDHKLFNFLLSYVQQVTGSDAPHLDPLVQTTCNFAYRRTPRLAGSSHYAAETVEDNQFGVDMRRVSHETPLNILPTGKAHLLFARIKVEGSDLPLTFVKFEPIGLGSYAEAADHAANFQASHTNVKAADRREKDVPQAIVDAYESAALRFSNVHFAGLKQGSNLKIYDMMHNLNGLAKHSIGCSDPQRVINLFKDKVAEAGYERDLIEIRNGNEVIFDFRDF